MMICVYVALKICFYEAYIHSVNTSFDYRVWSHIFHFKTYQGQLYGGRLCHKRVSKCQECVLIYLSSGKFITNRIYFRWNFSLFYSVRNLYTLSANNTNHNFYAMIYDDYARKWKAKNNSYQVINSFNKPYSDCEWLIITCSWKCHETVWS